MAKQSTIAPEVGDQVLVRYLENPNAVRAEAPAVVLAAHGSALDLEVRRPGAAGPLRLYAVGQLVGDGGPAAARPHWVPLPVAAPARK